MFKAFKKLHLIGKKKHDCINYTMFAIYQFSAKLNSS